MFDATLSCAVAVAILGAALGELVVQPIVTVIIAAIVVDERPSGLQVAGILSSSASWSRPPGGGGRGRQACRRRPERAVPVDSRSRAEETHGRATRTGVASLSNCPMIRHVPLYRLQDTSGDDLGLLDHPSTTLEPGDVVQLPDGRAVFVTSRTELESEQLWALLEVLIAPSSPAIPT